jgi:hypothetical protein
MMRVDKVDLITLAGILTGLFLIHIIPVNMSNTMTTKRMSDFNIHECGEYDGKVFIVIDRIAEDRVSGGTVVQYENGDIANFAWDHSNPTPKFLGKGKRIMKIVLDGDQ